MFWKRIEALSRILERPLPRIPWLRRLAALLLSVLPFFSIHPILLGNSAVAALALAWGLIALAVYAATYMVVSALLIWDAAALAIMAKRVGFTATHSPRLSGLDTEPLGGLFRLFVTVVCVGCALATAASSVTYSLVHNCGFGTPFSIVPSRWEVFLFFVDQSLKGMFFDFCEVFQISVQRTLSHRATFHEVFPYVMFVYRLMMNALTLQIMFLSLTFIFFSRRDDRVAIADELADARQRFSDARDALEAAEQKIEDRRTPAQLRRLAAEHDGLRRRPGRRSRSTRERMEELERILDNNDWRG